MINHILLHCGATCRVYGMYNSRSLMCHGYCLVWWNMSGNFLRKRHRKAWRLALLYLFWTIWQERNWRTFEGVKKLIQLLKDSLIQIFSSWSNFCVRARCSFVYDSLDWVGLHWCIPFSCFLPLWQPLYISCVFSFYTFYLTFLTNCYFAY